MQKSSLNRASKIVRFREELNSISLDGEAKRLRLQVAADVLAKPKQRRKSIRSSSFVTSFQDELSLPSGQAGIAFNDQVTDETLRTQILPIENPWLVAFLGAKVIEQSLQLFFDPKAPTSPVSNLIVAKEYGTFFTPPDIAENMARLLVEQGSMTSVVDPCLGSGSLLSALLLHAPINRYRKLTGVELDPRLAQWATLLVHRVADIVGFSGSIEIINADGLAFLGSTSETDFDILINPPYGRVRFTSDRATNKETAFSTETSSINRHRARASEKAKSLRTTEAATLAKGILEYSKLFMQVCASHCAGGSTTVIISPDSWMSGRESAPLRQSLIREHLISEVILVRESHRKFSTVNQSTSITVLNARPRHSLGISAFDDDQPPHQIPYNLITRTNQFSASIPRVSGAQLDLFIRLDSWPKFQHQQWLTNVRGELDQTNNKALFGNKPTTIPLVRGEHITPFLFAHTSTNEKPSFVDPKGYRSFISGKPKEVHFGVGRIAGRQCSYAQQSRRLYFCRVPPNHAIGNSCNYLIVKESEDQGTLSDVILGLLNSSVIDWFFRIENSNNHVANYEIDNLPFPRTSDWIDMIAATARQLEEAAAAGDTDRTRWLNRLLDATTCMAFEISGEAELDAVLGGYSDDEATFIKNLVAHLKRGAAIRRPKKGARAFDHETPTLSALDRSIIEAVPEGGNWQDIPLSVPSARLEQIRAMTAERGVVRTTYYGRLRRDQPAYTINTYFNRPGNGTHIHPTLARTLTNREAARLQSFPDSYQFCGTDGAVRNQIGNAVPPRLAYAIGNALAPARISGKCVDVFCGAGGISLGLEAAGWDVIAAIDNDQQCLDTYSINRPCQLEPIERKQGHTAVYRRDLHDVKSYRAICSRIAADIASSPIDLLIGGPPCQGFSHAGFRDSNDRRNDLASAYLDMAKILKPRIFILENVEGLATFKGGQVLRDICDTLAEMGFSVSQPIWKLHAEQYGVPQMRRRLFVVATRDKGLSIHPPEPTHQVCPGRRTPKASDDLFASHLPPPLTVANALAGLSLPHCNANKDFERWLNYSLIAPLKA